MTVADVLLWFFGMILAAAFVLAVFIAAACWFFGWGMDWWERRHAPEQWISDAELDRRITAGEADDAWKWPL